MTDFTTLQGLLWPEITLCPDMEPDMYLRLGGGAAIEAGTVCLPDGGTVSSDTYGNLFSLGKWQARCGLEDLHLALFGQGQIALEIVQETPQGRTTLLSETMQLDPTLPGRVTLASALQTAGPAVLSFHIRAINAAQLSQAAWQTRQAPLRRPEMVLAITTFGREEAVRKAVARFERFMQDTPLSPHMHLIVVDNGQTAHIPASPHVTPVNNPNLGGAGGFARAMLEARARGASHCLFMDDDAAVQMGCHERTWMFLAYARDPATALSGAMLQSDNPRFLWENGALFNARCMPRHMGTDLCDAGEVAALEFETTDPFPPNFYGGWWYFAFPLDSVRYLPFPFFVRGDDVSFCLAHDFNIVTLPGVASYQDSFPEKESPLTWYLDLRSHMAHHLSLPHMEIGRMRVMMIAVWFHLRNIIRCHYDTQAALNLAFEDVLAGPDFFAQHPAAEQRRAEIRGLTRQEAWQEGAPGTDVRIRLSSQRRLYRLLMKVTLNGHLLPFFSRFGNHIRIRARDRNQVRPLWGAAEITCVDRAGGKFYVVRHSKRRMFRETARLAKHCLLFLWRYRSLRAAWRAGYPEFTSQTYWQDVISRTTPGK